jgi:Family of unknown function (DUF5995)
MKNINEVLMQLRAIVEQCRDESSAKGYFATLYYAMTAAVQRGIAEGAFEDGPRMERLDVLFAQRYVDAFQARQLGWPLTRAWTAAFDAADADEVSVLQHLLLGINAHINLDLGIAAAQTAPAAEIWALEHDFAMINTLIAQLTERVQQQLGIICPPIQWLDRLLKTEDEGIADFSINIARRSAWHAATALAFLEGNDRQVFIDGVDQGVAAFAQRVSQPKGWLLRSALQVIKSAEQGTVQQRMAIIGDLTSTR